MALKFGRASKKDITEMLKMQASGSTVSEIATQFSRSEDTVQNCLSGRSNRFFGQGKTEKTIAMKNISTNPLAFLDNVPLTIRNDFYDTLVKKTKEIYKISLKSKENKEKMARAYTTIQNLEMEYARVVEKHKAGVQEIILMMKTL